jgi:hypothetical protein
VLTLKLPQILTDVNFARIEKVYLAEMQFVGPGSKLLDLRVDLSAAALHDCPPVSFYRLAFRERAWVRRLGVTEGDIRETGAELALFSTEESEPIDGVLARAARITTAGIIYQSAWQSDTTA